MQSKDKPRGFCRKSSRWPKLLGLLMLAVGAMGCEALDPTGDSSQQVFLQYRQTEQVGRGLQVTFEAVDDRRCPLNPLALCYAGGEALVTLDVRKAGGAVQRVVLSTMDAEPKPFGGWAFRLLQIDPSPRLEGVTNPQDYRIRLEVSRS